MTAHKLHATGLCPAALSLPLPSGPACPAIVWTGPSGAGKSSAIAALSLLLTAALPDGTVIGSVPSVAGPTGASSPLEICLQVAQGPALYLSRSPSGATTWQRDGMKVGAKAKRADALGPVGREDLAELVRAILSPDALATMAAEGGGRALRRALLAALPERSERRAIDEILEEAGQDPATDAELQGGVKACEVRRTDANRAADRAHGAHREARAAHEAAVGAQTAAQAETVAGEADLATARAVIEAGQRWADFDRAASLHRAKAETRASAERELARHAARLAALPAEPPKAAAPDKRLAKLREQANTIPEPTRRQIAGYTALRDGIAATAGRIRPDHSSTICLGCGEHTTATKLAANLSDAEAKLRTAQAGGMSATDRALLADLETAEAARLAVAETRAAWETRRRDIGDEPTVPPLPPSPKPPTSPRPTPAELDAARQTIARAQQGQGAAEARAQAVETTRAALATATERHELAATAATRAEAILAAARAAPARILAQHEEVIASGLPAALKLAITLPGEGRRIPEDGLLLTRDGRPLASSSSGEVLRSLTGLSIILRKWAAARYDRAGDPLPFALLPVCVDGAERWAGVPGWPVRQGGPLLLITTATTPSGGIEVSAV